MLTFIMGFSFTQVEMNFSHELKYGNGKEVKTYSKERLGTPAQKLDQNKLKKLEKVIQKYTVDMQVKKDISVDVICVYLQPSAPKFEHFKGIRLDA